ncbi:hypothetical protein [Amycolatopsis magusensis]|uniref:hypothetical protein n=1 Tax=Amycolatopsis magusensis TaxID=882444 RepID=UPI0037A521B1
MAVYERKGRAGGMAVDYMQKSSGWSLQSWNQSKCRPLGRGIGLREIETHIRGGSTVVLRSKHAETVRQGLRALLLTHYAIRHLMTETAEQAARSAASMPLTCGNAK